MMDDTMNPMPDQQPMENQPAPEATPETPAEEKTEEAS